MYWWGLVVGQTLAIAAAYLVCRKVPIRDHDSYLSVARLLRTAMNKVKGESTKSGKDLADILARDLAAPDAHLDSKEHASPDARQDSDNTSKGLKYGPRRVDGGEVDLWD